MEVLPIEAHCKLISHINGHVKWGDPCYSFMVALVPPRYDSSVATDGVHPDDKKFFIVALLQEKQVAVHYVGPGKCPMTLRSKGLNGKRWPLSVMQSPHRPSYFDTAVVILLIINTKTIAVLFYYTLSTHLDTVGTPQNFNVPLIHVLHVAVWIHQYRNRSNEQ